MTHIAIVADGVDIYDLALDPDEGDRLMTEESFRTAVLISILTERRATPAEAPDPSNLGGYWGDTYPDVPGDQTGSLLWTLLGRQCTAETLALAEGHVRDCLAWMIEDGIVADAQSLVLEFGFSGHSLIGKVGIKKPSEPATQWITAWQFSLER